MYKQRLVSTSNPIRLVKQQHKNESRRFQMLCSHVSSKTRPVFHRNPETLLRHLIAGSRTKVKQTFWEDVSSSLIHNISWGSLISKTARPPLMAATCGPWVEFGHGEATVLMRQSISFDTLAISLNPIFFICLRENVLERIFHNNGESDFRR